MFKGSNIPLHACDRLVLLPGLDAAPLIDACPHISANRKKIAALPAVKSGLESRPDYHC